MVKLALSVVAVLGITGSVSLLNDFSLPTFFFDNLIIVFDTITSKISKNISVMLWTTILVLIVVAVAFFAHWHEQRELRSSEKHDR